MATPQSSGAVYLYVGVPASTAAVASAIAGGVASGNVAAGIAAAAALAAAGRVLFLGTGKTAPDMDTTIFTSPITNDISGERARFDVMFQGMEGFSTVDLTYWNQATLNIIQALPNRFNSMRGGYAANEVGSLMALEGLMFPLYCVFSRRSAPSMLAAGMPNGRRWFYSMLEGNIVERRGTKSNEISLRFFHLAKFFPASGAMALYDENVSAAAGIPPI